MLQEVIYFAMFLLLKELCTPTPTTLKKCSTHVRERRTLVASLTLTVNEKKHAIDVNPETPLLWVLRDTLGLTGTKFGCGRALCGACMVFVDGEATQSCVTPVGSTVNKKVTTIEGLSVNRSHPVQRAWIAEDVPQCGYCQSGQIMAAAALLNQKPKPTDADIDAAMTRVLCRCGTYQRIRRAIHRAAAEGGAR